MNEPLDRYLTMKTVSAEQAAMAARFARDAAAAQRHYRRRCNPLPAPSATAAEDAAAAARLEAICERLGPLRRMVIACAVHGRPAGAFVRAEGGREVDAPALLRAALSGLGAAYAELDRERAA